MKTEGYINLNGDLLKEKQCGLSVHNRGFKFGDCLFETVRIKSGRALFTEDHFSRLTRGMKELKFESPANWSQGYFRKELQKTIEKNAVNKGGRLRFTLFRKGPGLYTPLSNEVAFTIECQEGENNDFIRNEDGLKLGIFDEIRIQPDKLSPLKTNNCLPFILAGIWAREKSFDEVLLLNSEGNLVEASSSNLFLFVDGMLYTPSLKEGATAGIMRKKAMQLSRKLGIPCIETSMTIKILEEAEEVFLTNAISGIRWVGSYQKKRFFHKVSEKLIAALNEISS